MPHPAILAQIPEVGNIASAEAVGRFHTYWRGDTLPKLPEWPELVLTPTGEARLFSEHAGTSMAEVQDRVSHGHRPWLAVIADEPVAWGWCATTELTIGELDLSCAVPTGNSYLWDFYTVPRLRGRGIYPRLLQAIVAGERDAERFWVGHDMPNLASARGIAKAGFREVGILYRQESGEFVLESSGSQTHAEAASRLFGITLGTLQSAMPT